MPTFMMFRQGQKVEEFSGANPQQLEDCVKRLTGGTAPVTGPIVGQVCFDSSAVLVYSLRCELFNSDNCIHCRKI